VFSRALLAPLQKALDAQNKRTEFVWVLCLFGFLFWEHEIIPLSPPKKRFLFHGKNLYLPLFRILVG
jgi:hypothetical protein